MQRRVKTPPPVRPRIQPPPVPALLPLDKENLLEPRPVFPPPIKRQRPIHERLQPRPALRCNTLQVDTPPPARSPATATTAYADVSTPELIVRLQGENETLGCLEQLQAQARWTSREMLFELNQRHQARAGP